MLNATNEIVAADAAADNNSNSSQEVRWHFWYDVTQSHNDWQR